MSKQIVLTQNDSAITIVFNMSKDKKPFDLTDKTVKASCVFPDNTLDTIDIDIIDIKGGKVELFIDKNLTEQSGLYKLFIEVYDKDNRITAQKMVVYYVLEEHGGVK